MSREAYKVQEVAELLGISRSSAYEAVKQGEIPSVRIGRRIVVPKRAFEQMMSAGLAPNEA